jgi:hypothetical protein
MSCRLHVIPNSLGHFEKNRIKCQTLVTTQISTYDKLSRYIHITPKDLYTQRQKIFQCLPTYDPYDPYDPGKEPPESY